MSDQVETKAFGTYACPRCGLDEPHAHGKGVRFKLRTFEYVILGYDLDEEESTWAHNAADAATIRAIHPLGAARQLASRHVLIRSSKGIVTAWWGQEETRWVVGPGASGNVVVEQPASV